jgi:hypothetical protein
MVVVGLLGYVRWQNSWVAVPLPSGDNLFTAAAPRFGEDQAVVEALLPEGPALETFLANQSDLTVVVRNADGTLCGQLATGIQHTRHGRRWRIRVRPGWHLQDGRRLDAVSLGQALASATALLGGTAHPVASDTLELAFNSRQNDLLERLTQWRVPGSGPFIRKGRTLTRFEGFSAGRAGLAGLTVQSDPALMESRTWADGVASGRWAWTIFPGGIAPEDMAKVRLASCDEVRLKDGTVWFLSRRLRRLRPDVDDWPRTRLFGVWQGALDLPYDPLGQ